MATGPKRSIGHLLGGEKNLVAILTVPPWPQVAASMESCRFAARRSLGCRFWSVVDVRKRLHRVRGRFDQSIHTSTGAWQCADLCHDPPKFSIQSSLESPKNRRMRSRRLPTIRATPIAVRGPICMQKKYPRMSQAVPSGRRDGMLSGRYAEIFGLGERLGRILNFGHSFDAIEAYP